MCMMILSRLKLTEIARNTIGKACTVYTGDQLEIQFSRGLLQSDFNSWVVPTKSKINNMLLQSRQEPPKGVTTNFRQTHHHQVL